MLESLVAGHWDDKCGARYAPTILLESCHHLAIFSSTRSLLSAILSLNLVTLERGYLRLENPRTLASFAAILCDHRFTATRCSRVLSLPAAAGQCCFLLTALSYFLHGIFARFLNNVIIRVELESFGKISDPEAFENPNDFST